jgi:hypothetical protein
VQKKFLTELPFWHLNRVVKLLGFNANAMIEHVLQSFDGSCFAADHAGRIKREHLNGQFDPLFSGESGQG